MNSTTIALISFTCIFGGALLGLSIRSFIPDHHMNDDSREIVKLGTGLIATLAALILGLLVSSAKGSLDAMNRELTQDGAKIILLDRMLASYGPETKEVRGMLRDAVAGIVNQIWPEKRTRQASLSTIESSNSIESIQKKIHELSPGNEAQRQIQSQAIQIAANMAQSRWLLIEQTQLTLPTTFLVVLLFWLTMLFAGFGLLSPRNATVISVLFLCAASLAGAIFLIMEMDTPVTGIIKVSSAPFLKALANLGR